MSSSTTTQSSGPLAHPRAATVTAIISADFSELEHTLVCILAGESQKPAARLQRFLQAHPQTNGGVAARLEPDDFALACTLTCNDDAAPQFCRKKSDLLREFSGGCKEYVFMQWTRWHVNQLCGIETDWGLPGMGMSWFRGQAFE